MSQPGWFNAPSDKRSYLPGFLLLCHVYWSCDNTRNIHFKEMRREVTPQKMCDFATSQDTMGFYI